MSNLTPYAQILITDPQSKFGRTDVRSYAYRADAKRNYADWLLDGLHVEHNLGYVILDPVYLPKGNGTSQWTLTGPGTSTSGWQECNPPHIGTRAVYQPISGTGAGLWTATTAGSYGPRWFLDVWTPKKVNSLSEVNITWPLTGTNRYRVQLSPAKAPCLLYTSDGSTYNQVDAYSGTYDTAFGKWARLMFWCANGHYCVGIDNHRWLTHYNPSAGTATAMQSSPIGVTGSAVAVCLAAHDLYFEPEGTGSSPKISRGFRTTATASARVTGNAGTSGGLMSATVTEDDDGVSFYYDFMLSAGTTTNGYATTTPLMRGVNISYPPLYRVPVPARTEELTGCTDISEHLWFDPVTLNLYNETVAQFHNEQYQKSGISGVRAVDVAMGCFETAIVHRLSGYGGHIMQWNTQYGEKSFRYHMFDRSIMLRSPAGVMVANLPYMDGWCIYRAIRYLANYAGIDDADLDFPLCEGGVDNPCGHYLMPYGDDFNPLVRFAGGRYVWDCMQQIQRYCGYALFFNNLGRLQFQVFTPSAPGAAKKQFDMVPAINWDGSPCLNECFGVSRTRDLRGVRNDVTIIGIDPETEQPIVSRRLDSDSENNILAENYLGYRSPMVWADSMFCTTAYADQAADAVFGVSRLPDDTLSIDCWLQQDLAPLDVIYVNDPASAPYNRPYWITSITNSISLVGGEQMQCQPRCHIEAQWLTPWG